MHRYDKPIDPATTPDEMRAAIFKHMHEDHLVRNVLTAANYTGMSAEDKYTALAYHALVDRQKLAKMVFDQLMITPSPLFVTMP